MLGDFHTILSISQSKNFDSNHLGKYSVKIILHINLGMHLI